MQLVGQLIRQQMEGQCVSSLVALRAFVAQQTDFYRYAAQTFNLTRGDGHVE